VSGGIGRVVHQPVTACTGLQGPQTQSNGFHGSAFQNFQINQTNNIYNTSEKINKQNI